MGFRYVVLGATGVGALAAADLAAHGEADEVLLADADAARAKDAAARAARLAKAKKVRIKHLAADPRKKAELGKAVKGADGVLSALPSELNAVVAQAAVQAKAAFVDATSDLEGARAVCKLAAAARKAGVAAVPACGAAPGLASALAVSAMTILDFAREVTVYFGVLPQRRTTAVELGRGDDGLEAAEMYLRPATVLRRGKVETVEPLGAAETIEVAGVGPLEACLTGGPASTCPFSFQPRLVGFECRTLRYPGHFRNIAALLKMGFLAGEPVAVGGQSVAPRDLFLALAGKGGAGVRDEDLVVLRVVARGKKHGRPTEVAYELVDRGEPASGVSAADRTRAVCAAAALWLLARGKVKPGAEPPEACLPHREFLAEVRRRGLRIAESVRAFAAQ